MKALFREISRNRVLAAGMMFLITAFLLALLSIYAEHHTYSRNTSKQISTEDWTVSPLDPPSFPKNLGISESYLSVISNVNLTLNVYEDELLLDSLNLTVNHERIVDLGGKTSALRINGTSASAGEITLSYQIKGFTLPWNVLGVPAAFFAIFGVVFAIKGYLSFLAEIKKVMVKK